jgi:sortase A
MSFEFTENPETAREAAITPEAAFDPLLAIETEEVAAHILADSGFEPSKTGERETVLESSTAPSTDSPIPTPVATSFSIAAFLRDKFAFLAHYLAVSTAVFFFLLAAANYSAYSTLLWNWISPDSIKASQRLVTDALEKSKITVYAADASGTDSDLTADDLKKKLEEANVSIHEDPLSPKKLVPAKPQINVDFDVVPYENRIIVPKIGKNIPLVDVEAGNNFDFDHMENIFMKELEKGVVRYPGTARPGETGNAFIFGHSSNYPWVPGQYNQVFALLDQLSFGDQIIVYYNQKKYVYVIREKKIVKPGDVKVLSRDDSTAELSLMTCWPVGTTLKRMIVFAELQTDSGATSR